MNQVYVVLVRLLNFGGGNKEVPVVLLYEQKTGIELGTKKGACRGDIPHLLLSLLAERNERFAGTFPSFSVGEHIADYEFLVVTEPIAGAAKPADTGAIGATGHADPLFD